MPKENTDATAENTDATAEKGQPVVYVSTTFLEETS